MTRFARILTSAVFLAFTSPTLAQQGGMPGNVPQGGMPQGMPGNMQGGAPQGMQGNMPQGGTPQGMPGNMQGGAPQGMRGNMQSNQLGGRMAQPGDMNMPDGGMEHGRGHHKHKHHWH